MVLLSGSLSDVFDSWIAYRLCFSEFENFITGFIIFFGFFMMFNLAHREHMKDPEYRKEFTEKMKELEEKSKKTAH